MALARAGSYELQGVGSVDADYASAGGFESNSSLAASLDLEEEDLSVDLERGLRQDRRATPSTRCRDLCSPARWKYPTHVEARVLSWASIVLTLVTSVAGLSLAVAGFSAAMLAFALEALVDILSSCVILWRFNGGDPRVMAAREERSSAAIGLSFIFLAVLTLIAAVWHLIAGERPRDAGAMLAITVPSFFLTVALGALKLHVGGVLNSEALKQDGVCSLGASVLSLGVIIGVCAYSVNDKVWWLDAVIALAVGIMLGMYGYASVRRFPWRTKTFWSPEPSLPLDDGRTPGGFERGLDRNPIDIDNI
jgi:hypothetical protein